MNLRVNITSNKDRSSATFVDARISDSELMTRDASQVLQPEYFLVSPHGERRISLADATALLLMTGRTD